MWLPVLCIQESSGYWTMFFIPSSASSLWLKGSVLLLGRGDLAITLRSWISHRVFRAVGRGRLEFNIKILPQILLWKYLALCPQLYNWLMIGPVGSENTTPRVSIKWQDKCETLNLVPEILWALNKRQLKRISSSFSLLLFCWKVSHLSGSWSSYLSLRKSLLIHHPPSCTQIESSWSASSLSSFFESVNLRHFFLEYPADTQSSQKIFFFR